MTDLRTLAQAVVDAWAALRDGPGGGIAYLVLQQQSDDAQRDLAAHLGIADTGAIDEVAERIIAALDAERKAGWEAGYDEGINDGMTK